MIQSKSDSYKMDVIMKTGLGEQTTSKGGLNLQSALTNPDLEFKAAAINYCLEHDTSVKKSSHNPSKYKASTIYTRDDGFPVQPKFYPLSQPVGEANKDLYPNFVADVLKSIEKPHEQQDFLIAVIKQSYKHPNGAAYIKKIGEMIGEDKIRTAEIVLAATKEINFKDSHHSHSREAIEKLYDDKVRGLEGKSTKLQDFDALMKVMHPEEFGKMLFSVEKTSTDSKLPEGLSDTHLETFKLAATTLKDHANKSRFTHTQIGQETAAASLLSNLSREQMAYIVKAVKSVEEFDKKDWLSQKLSNFVDAIQKLFSKEINNNVVKAGVKQILEVGANITLSIEVSKTKTPTKASAVDRLVESKNMDKGQTIQK